MLYVRVVSPAALTESLTDRLSQILIVGAMVVGPEYNAIIGVALGITRRVLNVVLLIVVGAAGLHTQRAIWRWRSPAGPTWPCSSWRQSAGYP